MWQPLATSDSPYCVSKSISLITAISYIHSPAICIIPIVIAANPTKLWFGYYQLHIVHPVLSLSRMLLESNHEQQQSRWGRSDHCNNICPVSIDVSGLVIVYAIRLRLECSGGSRSAMLVRCVLQSGRVHWSHALQIHLLSGWESLFSCLELRFRNGLYGMDLQSIIKSHSLNFSKSFARPTEWIWNHSSE